MNFSESREQGWVAGFAYGSRAGAGRVSSNVGDDPSSYLWSKTSGNAQPFTQMYLRPQLRTQDLQFAQPNEQGVYAGSARRALPNSGAERTTWGATGYANGRQDELNTQVQAFAQVGDTVFIGGNFAQLDRDQRTAPRVSPRRTWPG